MARDEIAEIRRMRRVAEYWNLVSQTAEYRFRICWRGARQLMTELGYDPCSTIQVACDQGDDVSTTFVLPDRRQLSCDFREDPLTRQAIAMTRGRVVETDEGDREDELAVEILEDPALKTAFDQAVRAFFDFHWRRDDRPLPPDKAQ